MRKQEANKCSAFKACDPYHHLNCLLESEVLWRPGIPLNPESTTGAFFFNHAFDVLSKILKSSAEIIPAEHLPCLNG